MSNFCWSLGSFTSGCAAGADGLAKEKGRRPGSPIAMPSTPAPHNEGKLTPDDIQGAASKAGLATPEPGDHTAILEKNSNLAEALGLSGTPGIIVMSVNGATPDTITVYSFQTAWDC